jgi:hypothetical protein
VVSTTPAAAPPPTHAVAVAPKPKRHRRPAKVLEHKAPQPVPVSRGAGGPAREDVPLLATPVAFHAFHAFQAPAFAPTSTGPSRARLLFLFAVALGLLLVFASALPGQALRPMFVYQVVVVHRLDFALVGFSIVVMVGALYLLTG